MFITFNFKILMSIPDRKKDLVKLQHGEYVSLSKVESNLLTCPLIDNVWVYGNSHEEYVVAFIVPNRKNIEALNQKVCNILLHIIVFLLDSYVSRKPVFSLNWSN